MSSGLAPNMTKRAEIELETAKIQQAYICEMMRIESESGDRNKQGGSKS